MALEKLYGLQDTIERKYKPWTVGALIGDLKLAGLADCGITAYLLGLVIDEEITLTGGMTTEQFKEAIIGGMK